MSDRTSHRTSPRTHFVGPLEALENRVLLAANLPTQQIDLAYDHAGNLHVAYYDSTEHDLKYTVRDTDGNWSAPVTVDSSSSDTGQQPSLALDSHGDVGIAYRDAANQDLKYAFFNGSSWKVSKVDSKQNTGLNPSLIFDAKGHALISYYRPTTKELRLATQAGKSWAIATLARKGAGQHSSITINPTTGKPAVAYDMPDGSVQYIEKGAGGFKKAVQIDSVGAGQPLHLAFDPSDNSPALAYFDPGSGKIKMAKKSSKTAFTTDDVTTVPTDSNPNPTLVFDPNTNQAEVVFYDAGNDGEFVATDDGAGNFDATELKAGADSASIATVGPNGHISFVSDSGGTASVASTDTTPATPTGLAASAASATQVNLTWSDNSNNETGFQIDRSADGGSTYTTIAITAPNVTTYNDTTAVESTTYTYRITALGTGGTTSVGIPLATATTLPAAASNLAVASSSASALTVTWSDNSSGESGYLVERSANSGNTWTTLATTAANATQFADSSLSEGTTYLYRVTALGAAGNSTSVQASGATLPATPTSLVATAITAARIDLSWSDNSSHESGYTLERSSNNGTTWSTLATLAANTTTYSDTTAAEGSDYVYRVHATSSAGSSANSNTSSASTVPAAPTGLTATPVTATRIDLVWTDNSTKEDAYKVERSSDGGSTFAVIATTAASATSYSDTSATEGTSYIYRVRAVRNSTLFSTYTTPANATTVPAAPTALSATSITASRVDLSWTDNSSHESGYRVERSTDGVNFTLQGTTAADATAYSDTTVSGGVTYIYRVAATSTAGNSTFASNSVLVIPPAPANLTATTMSTTRVDLSWTASAGASQYIIERSSNGFVTFTSFTPTSNTSYSDTTASEASVYTYRVRASNSSGQSTNSNANATTFLAAPSNLNATSASPTSVSLTWTDNSGAETGFEIDRSTDGGTTFPTSFNVAAGTTSYTDSTVTEGNAYVYRVRGTSTNTNSDYTSNASATTPLIAPTGLNATSSSPTSVSLTWTDNSNVETGYAIWRSTDGGNTFSQIGTASANAAAYTDSTALEAHSYVYKVKATGTLSNSAFSSTSSITTAPAAPTALNATVISATRVDLTWTDNSSGETGYLVQRSTDGVNFNTIHTTAANATSYSDTTGSEVTSYTYQVIASGTGGNNSAPSSTVTVLTLAAAPSNLTGNSTTATNVHLTWTDNSSGESNYLIERSSDNGSTYSTVATIAANSASYDDATASAATSYVYRVSSLNSNAAANPASTFTVLTKPAAPAGLAASAASATRIDLTWTSVTGASSYNVDRSTDGGNTFSSLATGIGTNSYSDTTATEAASFTYRVYAVNASGASAASSTSSATTYAAAPSNLSATPVTATRVDLTWSDNSAGESGFRLERSSNGGLTWSTVTSPASNATSYSDTGVSGGTSYSYRIFALDTTGDSAASNSAAATTIPAAPSSLTATVFSHARVDLSWSDVNGETSYSIERSSDGGNTFSQVGTTSANVLAYSDSTVAEATSYVYRIKAVDSTGSSLPSATSTVLTLPAPVTNLIATVVSATRVDLAWTDNSAGETGFLVERSSDGGVNFSPLAIAPANSTSYSDTAATEATGYVYRVKPINVTGTGVGATVSTLTVPAAPTNLNATPISAGEIDLTWTDNSAGENHYVIERSTDGGVNYSTLTTLGANTTSYHDTSVTGGNTYKYRVHATDATGSSANSNVATSLTIPAAVTDLAASTVSATRIDLSWTDVNGETGYTIERSADNGSTWSTINSPVADSTSYSDTGVSEGLTYTYRITSANGTGSSATSNTPSATTLPATPSNLNANPISATRVDLSWTDNSAHEDGFEIQRSSDNGANWTTLTTTAANAVSYSDTGADGGTAYLYQIRAVQASQHSPFTATASATTYPAAVSDLAGAVVSATRIDLTWSDVNGETSYQLDRSDDGGSNWNTIVPSLAANSTSYSDTTVTEAATFQYRLYAINGTGTSALSNIVTKTTVPAAPSALNATPINATRVDLTWTDNSSGETGFRVERSSDNGANWSSIATPAANANSYSDTNASGGTDYVYRVFAVNATGDSAASNTHTATTYPDQVTGPSATTISAGEIDLSWTAVTGAATYTIESSTDNGNTWNFVHTVSAPAHAYADTSVTEATAYLYHVYATNTTGDGTASASSAATSLPAAPSALSATPVTATRIDLAWTDNSGGETGYDIQRSTDGGDTWTTIHTTAANAQSYSDTTVSGGTSYTYQVLAADSAGDSDPSNTDAALTVPAAPASLTPTVMSSTRVDLSWSSSHGADTYTLERSGDNGSNWSTLITGTADTSFSDANASEAHDYIYRVSATDATGTGAATTANATTLPAAPTSLGATPINATRINLAWTDNSSGETGFRIERSDDGGDTWNPAGTPAANAVSDSDLNVVGGHTYQYRIYAVNATGDSLVSNTVTATTVPVQVTNLLATTVSDTQVNLTWTDVTGETSYTIQRSDDNGNTWTTLATHPAADATSFSDTTAVEATDYLYQIFASDSTGDGIASATAAATTLPAAPSALSATGQNTTDVALTWTDNSSGETGYKVERSDDNGANWNQLTTLPADSESYTDITGSEGASYLYRVRAYNAAGNSAYSSNAAGNTAPAAPTGAGASANTATSVAITWTDNSAGEDGFTIQRSADNGVTWSTAGTVSANVATFDDNNAPEGTALKYQVLATKGSVDSANSNVATVTTVPAAPSALGAVAASPTEIDLTWTDNSAHETGFEIQYSTDNGDNWNALTTPAANAINYNDTGALEGADTVYRIRANGAGGNSTWSATAHATTPLAQPTGLTVNAISDSQINLSWTDNSGTETGYRIEVSTDGGTNWSTLTTLGANANSYSDTSVTENITYTYRVFATNDIEDSPASATSSVKTPLTAPATTTAVGVTATSVLVSWSDSSGQETSYKIERSDDGGTNWNEIASIAANSTSYTDSTVAEATPYQYRVRAAVAGNFSAYGPTASVTTVPAAPTSASATPFSSTRIDLSWTDNSAGETGFVIQRSADNGANWTTLTTTAANATTYSDTGATEATDYLYRLHAIDLGGSSTDSNSASTTSLPATPTGLNAAVIAYNEIDLTWTDNSSGETGYKIERSDDNGTNWNEIGTTAANASSYHDTTVSEASPYVYRIRANRNSTNSAYSATASATTVPAAPTFISAVANTTTKVTLTWTDNSNGETGYKIERSTDGGSTWTQINTTVANATTYADNTVTEGGSYTYRLRAYNATGNSTYSSTQTASTPPAAPSALGATAASATQVNLTWTDHSSHETGFSIERSTDGGSTFSILTTVDANITSYSDTSVTENITYQYRVRAFTSGANSTYSASASVLTPLAQPTGLNATTISSSEIDLAWTDNSSAETSYKVEQSTDGGNTWNQIASIAANSTSYANTGLTEGTTYMYRVRASKTGNNSAYSTTSSATTLPAAPTNMSASVASATQVNLTWTDNSAGETGFVVQRSTDGVNFSTITTTVANATGYNDTTATEGTAYTYRVQATNAGGSSTFSTSSSVTTLPAAPTNANATSSTSDSVTFTWTDNAAHETGFKIERSDDNGSTWGQIATVGANITTFTDTTVAEATAYQYRVRAYQGGANSAYSSAALVTTLPAAPSGLNASSISSTRIDLTWTDNSTGAQHYLVERSTDGGANFTQIASLNGNANSYSDTGLTEGTDYQYRVRASNTGGNSAYTATAETETRPAAASGLAASAASSTEVDLSWTDNSGGENGYLVQRSDDGGTTWSTIDTIGPDSNSYADTTVTTGNTYKYQVIAFNDGGNSANSNVATVTTP